jgi:hypothetical protein
MSTRTTGTRSAPPKCAGARPRARTARRRTGGIRRARDLTHAVLDSGHGPHHDHVRQILYIRLGSVGYEPELNVRGERLIWSSRVVDRLVALRRSAQSILRLVELETGKR